MKRLILFPVCLVAMALVSISAKGQGVEDVLRNSQYNYSLSTARSAAMGGAFVSLGSDASSMSINPAGLGMYRDSEITITPGLRISNIATRFDNGNFSNSLGGNVTKFRLSNFGAVFSGRMFTFGLGYNRLADFAGNSYSMGGPTQATIGDHFANVLNSANDGAGVPSGNIGAPAGNEYQAFYKYGAGLWPSILAYQTWLIDPTSEGGSQYSASPSLFSGDLVTPQQSIRTSGAIDEITFSGAFNINDKVYFGATLGVQDIRYSMVSSYGELADQNNEGELDNLTYNQQLTQTGVGFNMKLGVTVRPVDWLRVGVAYHSPTWTRIDEKYAMDMTVYMWQDRNGSFADSPILDNEFSMRSPNRLMLGVSGTIARRLILSLDYERVWYGDMKFRSPDFEWENNQIKQIYGGADNIRVGAEVMATKNLFVRAGYAMYDSPYRNENNKKYDKLNQYSVGVGYRTKYFTVDAAYIYGQSKNMPNIYYAGAEGVLNTTNRFSNVLLTLGVRF